MPLIEWQDKFKTGDPGVDEEHREIIDLINQLHEKLQKTDLNREDVSDFLGDINTRISAHFALEESIMREKNYEDYTGHKADHDQLLDDIRDIMDYYDNGSYEEFESELSIHLKDWFTVHFATRDAKLHTILGV